MRAKKQFVIAFITAPDLKVARKLSNVILRKRLAACANLIPKIESHYWWKGKITSNTEVLMILKTSRAKLAELEKCVVKNHPYDTPEFLALPISSGNKKYLHWILDSVR
ncbi:MAG: divalent-cation tolerance protein CutA [Verrucomicrobiota bacterium]